MSCNVAFIGLKKIFKSGIKYKKAGVIVMGITSDKNYQMTLFENEKTKLIKHYILISNLLMKHFLIVKNLIQIFGMKKTHTFG